MFFIDGKNDLLSQLAIPLLAIDYKKFIFRDRPYKLIFIDGFLKTTALKNRFSGSVDLSQPSLKILFRFFLKSFRSRKIRETNFMWPQA